MASNPKALQTRPVSWLLQELDRRGGEPATGGAAGFQGAEALASFWLGTCQPVHQSLFTTERRCRCAGAKKWGHIDAGVLSTVAAGVGQLEDLATIAQQQILGRPCAVPAPFLKTAMPASPKKAASQKRPKKKAPAASPSGFTEISQVHELSQERTCQQGSKKAEGFS